jgi:hypothetical protein
VCLFSGTAPPTCGWEGQENTWYHRQEKVREWWAEAFLAGQLLVQGLKRCGSGKLGWVVKDCQQLSLLSLALPGF